MQWLVFRYVAVFDVFVLFVPAVNVVGALVASCVVVKPVLDAVGVFDVGIITVIVCRQRILQISVLNVIFICRLSVVVMYRDTEVCSW